VAPYSDVSPFANIMGAVIATAAMVPDMANQTLQELSVSRKYAEFLTLEAPFVPLRFLG